MILGVFVYLYENEQEDNITISFPTTYIPGNEFDLGCNCVIL